LEALGADFPTLLTGSIEVRGGTAGQFLWVEESCPEIRLLAPVVDFLLARRADFRWRPNPAAVRHEDLAGPAMQRILEVVSHHVEPPEVFVGWEKDDAV